MSDEKKETEGAVTEVTPPTPPATDPQKVRFWIASILTFGGMVLLFTGFWVPPVGEIHRSVLLAYGEVMTFVGALIGIDYVARERIRKVCRED